MILQCNCRIQEFAYFMGILRSIDTMGFFSKVGKPAPSTANDPAALDIATHSDPEKQVVGEIEAGNDSPIVPHVTPDMEKAVVRKMDKRLVPLVMGLCMDHF